MRCTNCGAPTGSQFAKCEWCDTGSGLLFVPPPTQAQVDEFQRLLPLLSNQRSVVRVGSGRPARTGVAGPGVAASQ